jgi:hypothetical protein
MFSLEYLIDIFSLVHRRQNIRHPKTPSPLDIFYGSGVEWEEAFVLVRIELIFAKSLADKLGIPAYDDVGNLRGRKSAFFGG